MRHRVANTQYMRRRCCQYAVQEAMILPKHAYLPRQGCPLDAVLLHWSQQTPLSHVQLHAAHRGLPRHDLVAGSCCTACSPITCHHDTAVPCEHSACVDNVALWAPLHQPHDR